MKNLITTLLIIGLAFMAQSCNLSKTVTVRDTVKAVGTTTADYYQGYDEVHGEFKLKDINHTVAVNSATPDMEISIIPAIEKHDAGYHIIKPAILSGKQQATALSAEPAISGEFKVKLRQLKPIEIPQRGN
jgi:hypothetical protein